MTVDNIVVAYDELPEGVASRTATLTLTDGASSITLKLTQDKTSSVTAIEEQAAKVYPTIFDSRLNVVLPDDAQSVEIIGIAGNSVYKTTTDGQQTLTVDGSQLAPGAYIIRIGTTSKPVMLKAIKR